MPPFDVGDVVVCVVGCSVDDGTDMTKKGAIYRIVEVRYHTFWHEWGVWLAGMNCGDWFGYNALRFRKIDADVTEEFREQLRKLPVREPAL